MRPMFVALFMMQFIQKPSYADTITLDITLTSSDGFLRAALYKNQIAFDKQESVSFSAIRARKGISKLVLNVPSNGEYGVALFQDENANGILDKNLFGAPTVPYGFSKNPNIGYSAPTFDSFKFMFDGQPMTLEIKLNGN